LDTGTHASLLEASQFIETVEKRQSLKIACLEEIAYKMGYITKDKLLELAEPLMKNQYGQYLVKVATQGTK
jgi:glucose-1-phosphate thymidylyltransferase